ncbi:hypothetical protein JTB14_021643 [Gonioctena quinquepunctata]|nr:hypothetical protein JTB14_021643 [Gonioctena quinquepunctata]
MRSSASSTPRSSEVMTIDTSKKRSPSSSTSSAPEKVDAMRNLDADLFVKFNDNQLEFKLYLPHHQLPLQLLKQ